jgi:hypothetical protein
MPSKGKIGASSYSEDILQFLRVLETHSVEYMIVGGEAVVFHGYPRFTGDIDFFYETTAENVERLFGALLEFWNGKVPGISSAAELMGPDFVVQFGRPPNRIDLHGTIEGVSYAEARRTREIANIDAGANPIRVYYIGKSALIKNKRASGRLKDLDDIANLDPSRE